MTKILRLLTTIETTILKSLVLFLLTFIMFFYYIGNIKRICYFILCIQNNIRLFIIMLQVKTNSLSV